MWRRRFIQEICLGEINNFIAIINMNATAEKVLRFLLAPFIHVRRRYWKYLMYNHPQKWADELYRLSFGRGINWDNPKDMNEKQRWIQFKTDTSEWTRLADKYAVRDYIKSKGLSEILVDLYGVWYDADQIDFTQLPNSFVMKTNHGCGEVMLVKDKSAINENEVRTKFRDYLNTPYGYQAAEYHYLHIKPCIIAEELLEDRTGLSTSLIDYKFYVFHGEPHACAVFFNRVLGTHNVAYGLYDMNWNCIENTSSHIVDPEGVFLPKPHTLDKMIDACKILAAQFPFVRLDFYEVNGQLYFGEFTFTPSGLNSGSNVYTKERMDKWGDLMDLSIFPNYKLKH